MNDADLPDPEGLPSADVLAMFDADAMGNVVATVGGQRAMLIADGWTQDQAGDIVAAMWRSMYRTEEPETT